MSNVDWILSMVLEIDKLHERVHEKAVSEIDARFLRALVLVGDHLTSAVVVLQQNSLAERFSIPPK